MVNAHEVTVRASLEMLVHVFMSSLSEMADAEITASFSVCSNIYREQTAPYAFESLSRMSNTDEFVRCHF